MRAKHSVAWSWGRCFSAEQALKAAFDVRNLHISIALVPTWDRIVAVAPFASASSNELVTYPPPG